MGEKVLTGNRGENPVDVPRAPEWEDTGPDRDTWSILFLTSIFFLSYNGRSITGPLLPAMEQDLGLSHAESGGLFLFLFLGYLVSILGSGFLAALVGHRRTIIISAVGVGIALIIAACSPSLCTLRMGLVVSGLASGLYPPSGIAALTRLAKPAHWGRAMGLHDVAPNLSIVATPAVAALLLGWTSWRSVYLLFGLIAIMVSFFFIRSGPSITGHGHPPNLRTLKQLFGITPLWILCLLFSLGAAGMIGVYNMLPLFLTTIHNFETSTANLIVSLSRIPGIGMVLVSGWFTDRVGPRRAIAAVFCASGLLGMLIGVLSGVPLVAVIFIQAAMASCFFPAGLAAVSQLFPFELRNLAIAIVGSFSSFVGSGAISALIGLFADKGLFGAGLVFNGGLVLLGLPALLFLKFDSHSE